MHGSAVNRSHRQRFAKLSNIQAWQSSIASHREQQSSIVSMVSMTKSPRSESHSSCPTIRKDWQVAVAFWAVTHEDCNFCGGSGGFVNRTTIAVAVADSTSKSTESRRQRRRPQRRRQPFFFSELTGNSGEMVITSSPCLLSSRRRQQHARLDRGSVCSAFLGIFLDGTFIGCPQPLRKGRGPCPLGTRSSASKDHPSTSRSPASRSRSWLPEPPAGEAHGSPAAVAASMEKKSPLAATVATSVSVCTKADGSTRRQAPVMSSCKRSASRAE
mmetsp:Transcript_98574/g.284400  ORF Transcript_98574/g.284400 Transcript_98574/m.284400 type:complete len:272 (+) Transcript_98574:247-1062(+)